MADRSLTRRIAALGTLAVVAYAALAAVQILVLNPLAAVPGRTLPQIEAELARWGESLGTPRVLGLLGFGVTLAVALLVTAWLDKDPAPWDYALGYLAMLVLGAPAYFVASFGAGMALADSFGISGGDHAPWALPLYIASALALVALVTLAVWPRRGAEGAAGVPSAPR